MKKKKWASTNINELTQRRLQIQCIGTGGREFCLRRCWLLSRWLTHR